MSAARQSGFAAEPQRTTEAVARADDSGAVDLKAACDRLSDGSKAVLSRENVSGLVRALLELYLNWNAG